MIKFNFDTSQPGRFSVSRFCLHYSRRNHQTENESSSRVEFVSDILSPTVHLEILNNPPVITMGLEEEKLYSGANGKLNFTITIGSKPMNNEKITFNATAGLQVISDIIQVCHISESYVMTHFSES